MPQAGGPTTQSGIYYQNTIAALYLGRLCDFRERLARDQVINVRVESPSAVDDIVILHEDGHRTWVQAKENISANGHAWNQLWASFEKQRWGTDFGTTDILCLYIGSATAMASNLCELAARAIGASSPDEWLRSLAQHHTKVLKKIRPHLSAKRQTAGSMFDMFQRVRVDIATADHIERDHSLNWMPPCNLPPSRLLGILRDKAGGGARYRRTFCTPELLAELAADSAVQIRSGDSNIEEYRRCIESMSQNIELPGTRLMGPLHQLFAWPKLRRVQIDDVATDHEERPLLREHHETIDLRTLPTPSLTRAAVVAPAGFGKTSLFRALAHHYAHSALVPAFIAIPELVDKDTPILSFLETVVSASYSVRVPWNLLCEKGAVLLLLDGFDEVDPAGAARVAARIGQFVARFPRVLCLISVRDARAQNLPAQFELVELCALDDSVIRDFCQRYLRLSSVNLSADAFLAHLSRSPGIRHLVRVPLLLVLAISYAAHNPEAPLPTRRSDLLAAYVETVFDRDARTPPVRWQSSKANALRAAEALAFTCLERATSDISERAAIRALADVAVPNPDAVLIDLKTSGLLRRAGYALSFTLPSVQEFLASIVLARKSVDEVRARVVLSISRPWAQSLQFAIERHEHADEIVTSLLEVPDDPFSSTLRLVARCIANGARVTPATKALVGDKLADLWLCQMLGVGSEAGELIAAGFSRPLPVKVRASLAAGKFLYGEGGAMLEAAQDPALTLEILQTVLQRDQDVSHGLYECKAALDQVKGKALDLYVVRAKATLTTRNELAGIAELIVQLELGGIAEQVRRRIIDDETVPPLIRLAVCHDCEPSLLPADVRSLILDVLAEMSKFRRFGRARDIVFDVMWRSAPAVEIWRDIAVDRRLSLDIRRSAVFSAVSCLSRERGLKVLRELLDARLTGQIRRSAMLASAVAGNREPLRELQSQLPKLRQSFVHNWFIVAAAFEDEDMVSPAIGEWVPLATTGRQRLRLASVMSSAVSREMELIDETTFRSTRRRPHSARSAVAHIVRGWAEEPAAGRLNKIQLLTIAVELGDAEAARLLRVEVTPPSRRRAQKGKFGALARYDAAVFRAIHGLSWTAYALTPRELIPWAMLRKWNVSNQAIHLIARCQETREALDGLMLLWKHFKDSSLKQFALREIERLSRKLGVPIWTCDGQLTRGDTPST